MSSNNKQTGGVVNNNNSALPIAPPPPLPHPPLSQPPLPHPDHPPPLEAPKLDAADDADSSEEQEAGNATASGPSKKRKAIRLPRVRPVAVPVDGELTERGCAFSSKAEAQRAVATFLLTQSRGLKTTLSDKRRVYFRCPTPDCHAAINFTLNKAGTGKRGAGMWVCGTFDSAHLESCPPNIGSAAKLERAAVDVNIPLGDRRKRKGHFSSGASAKFIAEALKKWGVPLEQEAPALVRDLKARMGDVEIDIRQMQRAKRLCLQH